uniref:F-box protein 43 n=1 Tax=Latimeria chalumnae TaxID=7897 RepID=H3B6X3_LATCH
MSLINPVLANVSDGDVADGSSQEAQIPGFKESCSTFLSQDSGCNESLQASSFEFKDTFEGLNAEYQSLSQEHNAAASSDPVSVTVSFTENEGTVDKKPAKLLSSQLYETPIVTKKDFTLRRKLLGSREMSGSTVEYLGTPDSAGRANEWSVSRISFENDSSNSFLDSPGPLRFEALATSTLKTEESETSCLKRRFLFAQQRTSTIDELKCERKQLAEDSCVTPVQSLLHSESILTCFSGDYPCPQSFETPTCNKFTTLTAKKFLTPLSSLAENFKLNLSSTSTPPVTPISKLDVTTEDSGFSSLSLDKSQDSLVDDEGSFQKLIEKPKGTPKTLDSKRRQRKLERVRRLSTLREQGSQSETDDDGKKTGVPKSEHSLKLAKGLVSEEDELVFNDGANNGTILRLEDLSKTPALQLVHEMSMRSKRKRHQKTTVHDLLGLSEGMDSSDFESPLARLIGRKMGLEKLDLIIELKNRNLWHILSMILGHLTAEGICSFWKVSKGWQDIIVQDKSAYQKRKLHLKWLKAAAEGSPDCVQDAATRLNLLNRSALRSVQAQAKCAVTPSSSVTPISSGQLLRTSKQEEYLKVAETLFNDEALKSCPKCRGPAKYQPIKNQGICSREGCAFDFCSLCLCAFHGSKGCGSGSTKRHSKKEALPGSIQSKRNLKRL